MQNTYYSIKQAAKISGLAESTLRYYEKMWLIPEIQRDSSWYRKYSETNLLMLSTIACLNATGMPIESMKQYVEWIVQGDASSQKQLDALKQQEKQIIQEEKALAVRKKYLKWKIKYWELVNNWDDKAIEQLKIELEELAKILKTM